MTDAIAYCGAPPVPGSLLARFNGDPVLIAALLLLASGHLLWCRRRGVALASVALGWGIAAIAVLSPLCALSVALFSARVGQHMILLLLAAPLIGRGLPQASGRGLWPATASFFVTLWLWHMPVPYDATLTSTPLYWAMHVSLFASAVWLWRELLCVAPGRTMTALTAGAVTSTQMGLLGAVLSLASHPLFRAHLFTSEAWGLTPLADQQLGGLLMWVPGSLFFLWVTLHGLNLLWRSLERGQTA